MAEEDLVELKFRLFDGSSFPILAGGNLKDRIGLKLIGSLSMISDKRVVPKVANNVKLISSGKVLDNNKTLAQCKMPLRDGLITMHAVVQPSLAKAKTEKKVDETPKKNICLCSIYLGRLHFR